MVVIGAQDNYEKDVDADDANDKLHYPLLNTYDNEKDSK